MFANKLLNRSVAGLLACAAAAASAASLNVKTGAWESTFTSSMTGSMLSADQLAKLPPAQREKVEAMMRAQSGKTRTRTNKSCITQKDLDEDSFLDMSPEPGCKPKMISKTSTRVEFERTCGSGSGAHTEHVVIAALSPESVTMVGDVVQASGKMHFENKGHWLGASCAGIK